MNEKDFSKWIKGKHITQDALKIIQNIRSSEPSRKVRSNGKNVRGFYPSKKMGVTIQFESHKLELAGIYEKEHDPKVIEYYDQPHSFKIKYDMPDGSKKKSVGHMYTPDFFTIEDDWIGWEEWKTEEKLIELSQKNPNRYCKDEDGRWRCPPAEEYAKQFGLSFRIRSSKEINWIFQRNIRFLGIKDRFLSYVININAKDYKFGIITRFYNKIPRENVEDYYSEEYGFNIDDDKTMFF